jgi:hypothetical protein
MMTLFTESTKEVVGIHFLLTRPFFLELRQTANQNLRTGMPKTIPFLSPASRIYCQDAASDQAASAPSAA